MDRILQGQTMTEKKYIARVWVDDKAVFAETTDGLVASYEFKIFPRLSCASDEKRKDFTLSYGGIHWPKLDEDLSFEGMFNHSGLCDLTSSEDSVCYLCSYNTDDSPLPTAAEE